MSKEHGKKFFEKLMDKLDALNLQSWKLVVDRVDSWALDTSYCKLGLDDYECHTIYYKTRLNDYEIILRDGDLNHGDHLLRDVPEKLILDASDQSHRLVSYVANSYKKVGFFSESIKYSLYEGDINYRALKYISHNDKRLIELYNKLREPIRRANREDSARKENEKKRLDRKLQDFMNP